MIARARMNSLSLLFARDLSREARGKTRVPLSLSLLNPLSSGFALSCFLKATQTNDKGARSKEEKCDDHHHLPLLKFPLLLRFTFVFCAGTRFFFFSSFSSFFLAGKKNPESLFFCSLSTFLSFFLSFFLCHLCKTNW